MQKNGLRMNGVWKSIINVKINLKRKFPLVGEYELYMQKTSQLFINLNDIDW